MRSERAADAAAVLGFCRAPDNDHVIATSGTSHGRTVKCSNASEDNTFRANWPRPVPFVGQRLGLGLEGRVHITGEMLPQRSAQRNLNSVLSGLVQ